MINRYKKILLISILGLFIAGSLSAQKKRNGIEYSGFFDSYYYRGPLNYTLAGGLTTFNGDICKFMGCAPSYYASLGASYQVWPRTYFGAELGYANLKGERADNLGFAFEHPVIQFDAYARFLLVDKKVTRHGQLRDKPYNVRPYITAGVGYVHSLNGTYIVNPALPFMANDTASLGYVKNAITFPLGIGFQIWFSHRVSIMPELIYRFVLTDHLDGISLRSDRSSVDAYATIGMKLQVTPTAPRIRKKKRSLPPPEEYTGPKGTDYPKKRRKDPAPSRYQPLPGDDYPEDGGYDDGGLQDDENIDNNNNGDDSDNQGSDDWGW